MLLMCAPHVGTLAAVWHEKHGMPAGPWPLSPATIGGLCGCRLSPCVGARCTGWQFRQRGLWITLPASVEESDRARGRILDRLEAGGGLQRLHWAGARPASGAAWTLATTAPAAARVPASITIVATRIELALPDCTEQRNASA
jgi:hypothetical protein